jgi:hypothetical protein
MTFDYTTPTELFMAKRKGGSRQLLLYRPLTSAAKAIRFAVDKSGGAWLQVCDERFDSDIQRLYDNNDYRCHDKIECEPSVGRLHGNYSGPLVRELRPSSSVIQMQPSCALIRPRPNQGFQPSRSVPQAGSAP